MTGMPNARTDTFGSTTYQTAHDRPGQPVDTSVLVQLRLSAPGYSKSGSLRLGLWAVPPNGSVGPTGVAGHMIWRDSLSIVGADGSTQNYLENSSIAFVQMAGTGLNPPAGEYCYIVGLEQYYGTTNAPCTTSDGYCLIRWISFPTSVIVQ